MAVGKEGNETMLDYKELEQVTEFVYLGRLLIKDGKCTMRCIGFAHAVSGPFGKL